MRFTALAVAIVTLLAMPAQAARGTRLRSSGVYAGLAGGDKRGELTLNYARLFSSVLRFNAGAGLDENRGPMLVSGLDFTLATMELKAFGGTAGISPMLGGQAGWRVTQSFAELTGGLAITGERLLFEVGGAYSTMYVSRFRTYINMGYFW